MKQEMDRARTISLHSDAYASSIEEYYKEKFQTLTNLLSEFRRKYRDLECEFYQYRHQHEHGWKLNDSLDISVDTDPEDPILREEFTNLQTELTMKNEEMERLKAENGKLRGMIESLKDEHNRKEEQIMFQMKALVDNREKREMIKPSHVYSASFDMSDMSEKILRLQRELDE